MVGAVFSVPLLSKPVAKMEPASSLLLDALATAVSAERLGFGECDDEATVLVFGLGFFATIVTLLFESGNVFSVSISMAVEELAVGASEIAGVYAFWVEFDDCCDEIGSGGDKRGRLFSGGDDPFVSLSRFGGWGNA